MTTSQTPSRTPARSSRRSNSDYRWTTAKVTAFLRALARCGNVAEAARSVGMSRRGAYRLKARLADPRFQHMFDLAQRTGRAFREEARQQALAERSPWGEAGLAGLSHLFGAPPQGHALRPQGHTLARKVTL